ncbi:glycosyltransferase family 2 protein [Paenibacillus sp. CF384]|uniref:glycosyltransferase family 2 protein n=1 Tax=Paenibacillus sp. CF384 TaxID=1884382 RepID=UPI0008949F70|nr:glycosyltransferase [Paenibacillus sp. CF384]SDW05343.1 Glycosyltransferase, GT2 family [Paenibacillus sp. CF384]
MAKVGVVMPVYYQNETYIRKAIQTVRNQQYRSFTFLIVIDGAPELLPLIQECTAGDPRVTIVSYPLNQGVAFALNYGFEILMDQGYDYLTWVSTDNIYYRQFLGTLVNELDRAGPNVGIVYSSFNQIFENGEPAHTPEFLRTLRNWQNRPKEALLDGCIIGPSFIHRAEHCRLVDGYRFKYIQDYDYWLRMTDYCDIKYVPIELMDYRINSPFSLSTHIANDISKHRLCWNEVHRSHYETRQRRSIPLLFSALFIVKPGEVARAHTAIGNIIDQYETNFELIIVSLTTQREIEEIIELFHDSRIRIFYYVNHSINYALHKALGKAKAEWCIIFDSEHAPADVTFIRTLKESNLMDAQSTSSVINYNGDITSSRTIAYLYQTMTVRSRMQAFIQASL